MISNYKSYINSFALFACGAFLGPILLQYFSLSYDYLHFKLYKTFLNDESEHKYSINGDIPHNAPTDCPGIESEAAGKSEACSGCPNQDICSSGAAAQNNILPDNLYNNLKNVKKKVLVLSGKGGVGKSTVASQISWLLQNKGFQVGLMDVDICGPSIPIMTNSRGYTVHQSADGWSPIYIRDNFAVMSIGFLIPVETEAVIWRGPKKNGLIRQFLSDVIWGDLDILIIDTPPGTSDEHLSIVTYLKDIGIDGALIVTTPQEVALMDVRKEITFCKRVNIPVLGLIENMTNSVFDSFITNETISLAEKTCDAMEIPYGGKIPLDQELLYACDHGTSIAESENISSQTLTSFNAIIDCLLAKINLSETHMQIPSDSL